MLAAVPPNSPHGERYLWVLSQVSAAGVPLLVVEQAGSSTLPADYPRLSISSTRRVFERSRLINQAAATLDCELLWIHSPELWLPFASILDRLTGFRGSLLKPFAEYFMLEPSATQALMQGQSVQGQGSAQGSTLGKASYLVDRQLFLAAGGLNEVFVGRAEEGFELVRRLQRFRPYSQTFSEFSGLWLHLPQTSEERKSREDNRELWRVLGQKMDGDSHLQTSLARDVRGVHRAALREAVRPIRPTPPPRRAQSLAGSLWGLTTYFNPAGYATKLENYRIFRERLGVPLLTVELAFEQEPFQLAPEDADILVQVRGADVLWQKERLLNLGLDRLPIDCDKVAWLDADVLFEDADWGGRVRRLLEQYVVVQPYSLSVRLRAGETCCETDGLPLGSAEHQILHGIALGVSARGPECLGRYYEHGHTGYAWAARRQLLQRHRFYDANILGNADLNMAQAMFAGANRLHLDRLSPSGREHLCTWAAGLFAEVGGSVAPLEGWIYHLWHGNKADRLYDRRLQVLVEQDYDPANDLRLDPHSGAYRWNSPKPGLHQWCRDYFATRREDPEGPPSGALF